MWAAGSITGLGTKMPHSVQLDQTGRVGVGGKKGRKEKENRVRVTRNWLELPLYNMLPHFSQCRTDFWILLVFFLD